MPTGHHREVNISPSPRVKKFAGPVHKNIRIEVNKLTLTGDRAIGLNHCGSISVKNNQFILRENHPIRPPRNLRPKKNTSDLSVEQNIVSHAKK